MFKKCIFLFFLGCSVSSNVISQQQEAEPASSWIRDIKKDGKLEPLMRLRDFLVVVNQGNQEAVKSVVLPSELVKKIQAVMADPFSYDFTTTAADFETPEVLIVKGFFKAESYRKNKKTKPVWMMSGFSNYFKLKKESDKWWIIETDFAKKLSRSFLNRFFSLIIFPLLLLFLLTFWMLFDCVGRDFEDRRFWFIMLMLFNFVAAFIYYFQVKRKNIGKKS